MVEKHIRIALYGNSLFMLGIAKSLEAVPGLEVIHVQPCASEAGPSSEGLGASLLAFDIHETPTELMLALFKGTPHLSLLALDPEGDRLMVLSSQVSGARTVGDLVQVIRSHGVAVTRSHGDAVKRGKRVNGER